MTKEEFQVFQGQIFDKLIELDDTKGVEYTRNASDRLANFRRLELQLDFSALSIAMIFLAKHLDAISYYIKTQGRMGAESEPICGRIIDAIKYLILIAAIDEDNKNQNGG